MGQVHSAMSTVHCAAVLQRHTVCGAHCTLYTVCCTDCAVYSVGKTVYGRQSAGQRSGAPTLNAGAHRLHWRARPDTKRPTGADGSESNRWATCLSAAATNLIELTAPGSRSGRLGELSVEWLPLAARVSISRPHPRQLLPPASTHTLK